MNELPSINKIFELTNILSSPIDLNFSSHDIDESYYHEAAERILKILEQSEIQANLYWALGLCRHYQGTLSGEASDLRQCIDYFSQAHKVGLKAKTFYKHFGNAYINLGFLINRTEVAVQGVDHFRNALELDKEDAEAWRSLALCLQQRYISTGNKEDFNIANETFNQGYLLNLSNAEFLQRWGVLLLSYGKRMNNLEMIEKSSEKFSLAHEIEASNPLILFSWGESLSLLGASSEKLELLKQGEEKILKSLELHEDNPSAWYAYGYTLNELGHYFEDEQYHRRAIDVFKKGLTFAKENPSLYYGLALSYFTLGEIKSNVEALEKSIHYFSKIPECDSLAPPQIWNDWGITLMKLSEITEEIYFLHEALDKFEKAIRVGQEFFPENLNPEWLYNYGCALDYLGDLEHDTQYYEQAAQVLAKVIQLDPNYLNARFNLGVALSHIGEMNADVESFQKAIECFHAVLETDNEDEMAWNEFGLTLIHFAQLIHDPIHPEAAQKVYEQAENKLQHAASLGCTTSSYNLACLHSLTGNYDNAMHYIEHAEKVGGLPHMDDLLNDEWLDSLRQTSMFRHFISHLATKQNYEL